MSAGRRVPDYRTMTDGALRAEHRRLLVVLKAHDNQTFEHPDREVRRHATRQMIAIQELLAERRMKRQP